ncbi:MAG: S46 family peptidase [Bacteroidales bacterium]|nr:S46 family peptidase [Bacteroidales bacterium]MBQ6101227.1 S46 family peptidase [Bacteroidales bacterium]
MRRLLIITALLLSVMMAKADEGMWLPYSLNGQNLAEMQAMGCKLTAEQIFSFNQPSIKDAIVQFGGGCTGEIISPEGLLLTNHHCGLSYVQKHSSVEHDYLTDGFWANEKSQELPNPGLSVLFLNKVEDVTSAVLEGVTAETTEAEREEIIDKNSSALEKERKGDRKVRVEVVSFYSGNQYILFEYDEYTDVRLVCCPPWGIGKFGADTDNWTWPRHKGDFNIFRVYTAPDGSPADYSADNIPMKSKWYLPINLDGVKPGDYAMILGYPGSTDRYSTSYTVKNVIEEEGPAIIDCRTTKLDNYRKHMDADQEVFIMYASKQASVSNYWKYYIGQVKQLKRNHVYERRQAQEEDFVNWVSADPKRMAEYGDIFTGIKAKWDILDEIMKSFVYHREAGWNGGEAIAFSRRFIRINMMFEDKVDKADIKAAAEKMQPSVDAFFKDYSLLLDQDVTAALLALFYKNIPAELMPSEVLRIGNENDGDFTAWTEKAFKKSIFTDKARLEKWMERPKSLTKDPIFTLTMNIIESYQVLYARYEEAQNLGNQGERLYMKGLMEMQSDRNFYPDANFTMRLTYGTVEPYKAADAVNYNYYTTMDGVMAKYVPGNWEFDIPQDVRDLVAKKDYGRYANENGELVVNFITTNDITGGNSGSPVIDGEGNLIGLAFDGNWEAMSGDLSFEQKVQRTICMDARYLLWCIEKVGKCDNIIKELVIK